MPWDTNGCKLDKNAFIFSLVNSYNTTAKLMFDNSRSSDCSINSNSNQGAVFGNDLYIANNANSNTNSYSSLGNYYYKNTLIATTQSYYDFGSNSDVYLAGSRSFQVAEIEVYARP